VYCPRKESQTAIPQIEIPTLNTSVSKTNKRLRTSKKEEEKKASHKPQVIAAAKSAFKEKKPRKREEKLNKIQKKILE